jgi:hypothetical protein
VYHTQEYLRIPKKRGDSKMFAGILEQEKRDLNAKKGGAEAPPFSVYNCVA